MRKFSIQSLDTIFAKIAADEKLYLPVDGESGSDYKLWEPGVKMSDALNTVRSAKDFFFQEKRRGKTKNRIRAVRDDCPPAPAPLYLMETKPALCSQA